MSETKEKVLWLLKGTADVDGWRVLEEDSKADSVDLVIFDRVEGWAILWTEEPPTKYEGMIPEKPKTGMYVSEHGYPIYVVDAKEVPNAAAVIDAVGGKAKEILDDIGDADAALQRAGYAY